MIFPGAVDVAVTGDDITTEINGRISWKERNLGGGGRAEGEGAASEGIGGKAVTAKKNEAGVTEAKSDEKERLSSLPSGKPAGTRGGPANTRGGRGHERVTQGGQHERVTRTGVLGGDHHVLCQLWCP